MTPRLCGRGWKPERSKNRHHRRGLVGMEMAEALRKWNVDVTVVEMQEQIFPHSLTPKLPG